MAGNLPETPAGKVYKIWAIAETPVPAGLFKIGPGSRVAMPLSSLPADKSYVKFAVTLEPEGGLPSPSGAMHLFGESSL
jgi:anti-sigma-K factor RskA